MALILKTEWFDPNMTFNSPSMNRTQKYTGPNYRRTDLNFNIYNIYFGFPSLLSIIFRTFLIF